MIFMKHCKFLELVVIEVKVFVKYLSNTEGIHIHYLH